MLKVFPFTEKAIFMIIHYKRVTQKWYTYILSFKEPEVNNFIILCYTIEIKISTFMIKVWLKFHIYTQII